MDNINFLTEILTSEHEYWITCKEDTWADGKVERSVWFIAIPQQIKRNIKKEEVLLNDLEKLRSIDVPNIPISQNYPPFQLGMSMYSFKRGFPITNNIQQFLIDALALKSKELWDYKKLLEEPKTQLEDVK